jgi:YHS domain-containing protein
MKRNFGKLLIAVAMTASAVIFASGANAGENKEAVAKLQSVKESYAASLRLEALQAKNSPESVRVSGPAAEWLKRVSAEEVNMATNRLAGSKQASVSIDGRDYFAAGDGYAATLQKNAAARVAVDPYTNKKIDKASALTYADASGRVFYFESEGSYREFIGMATPETVYGYSAPR